MSLYTNYTDGELVSFLQNGDEGALREIYDRYWKRLLYKACQVMEDVPLAEEAIQDVFLSLWKRRENLQLTGELKVYLFTSVTYNIIKYRQKRKREQQVRQQAAALYPQSEDTTDKMVAFELLQERITQLVADLPEQTFLIYTLHKEEGQSYKEIAAALNISPKTVDYHLTKAVKHLRAALSQLISLLVLLYC